MLCLFLEQTCSAYLRKVQKPITKLELQPLSLAAPVAPPEAAPPRVLAAVREDAAALFALLTGSRLNALLVCVPLGCLSQALGWSPLLRFTLVRAGTPRVRVAVGVEVGLGAWSASKSGSGSGPDATLKLIGV